MLQKQYTEGIYNIYHHDNGNIEKIINPELISNNNNLDSVTINQDYQNLEYLGLSNLELQEIQDKINNQYIIAMLENISKNLKV